MEPSGSGVWCVPGAAIDDRYLLVREIGRGGMGVVYEARRTELGLSVALKFLRIDRIDSPHDQSRFAREMLCVSVLRHENIVQLLDVGSSVRGPYAVFEFVPGSSLAELVDERGPFEATRAIGIMLQIGRALMSAHAAGVIHRDLKASNVMLTEHADGRDLVKVLDFGIAKTHDSTDAMTPTEGPAGTVGYMAPEVARGESRGDPLTDIYSMGVLFYELLSSHRPHHGDSPNALLHSVMTKPSVPLESHRPDLPENLRDLIRRTISANRDHRPQTTAQFVDELSKIAAEEATAQNRRSLTTATGPSRRAPFRSGSLFRTASTLLCGTAIGAALSIIFTRESPPRGGGIETSLQEPPRASSNASEAEVAATPPKPRELVDPEPSSPKAAQRTVAGSRRSAASVTVPTGVQAVRSQIEATETRIDRATGFDTRNPYE